MKYWFNAKNKNKTYAIWKKKHNFIEIIFIFILIESEMKHNSKLNEIKTYSKVQIIKLEKCQNEYIELLNEYQSMYMFIQVQVCSYQNTSYIWKIAKTC